MQPADDFIIDLIEIADVPLGKRSEARRWLEFTLKPTGPRRSLTPGGPWTSISPARSLYIAAGQRGTPEEHNAPLLRVERAADELVSALENLRTRGYSHSGFWLSEEFGPIEASQFERGGVFEMLEIIRRAADAAKFHQKGRPPELGKQRIVDLALTFFLKFSENRGEKARFTEFAERFFEEATEEHNAALDRQISIAWARRNKKPAK